MLMDSNEEGEPLGYIVNWKTRILQYISTTCWALQNPHI